MGSKKYRQKYNKFVVEGHKSCIEFIRSGKYKITELLACDAWFHENENKLDIHSIKSNVISQSEMKSVSHFKTPSPVLLVCEIRDDEEINLADNHRIIYLDNIQDPGNVGTIIRIADWFGIEAIVSSEGTVDKYNPKVISGSMGSFVNVPFTTDSGNLIDELSQSHSFIGADMDGESFTKFNYPKKSVLCLGNEGHGFSPDLRKQIHSFVSIPGSTGKIADSLNVGVAAAILCSAWTK